MRCRLPATQPPPPPVRLPRQQAVAAGYWQLLRSGSALTRRLSAPPGLPGVVASRLLRGASVDLSDPQWRAFRGALPLLCAAAAASSLAARLARLRARTRSLGSPPA